MPASRAWSSRLRVLRPYFLTPSLPHFLTSSPHPFITSSLDAFSLVEIVIAIAILSVGLVGALRVFPVGLRASQRSEVSSRSAIIAQRTLESLKLKPWNPLTDGEKSDDVEGLRVTTRIRSVTIPPLTDPARIKALEVAVQSTQQGRARTLTCITYVRRPPS